MRSIQWLRDDILAICSASKLIDVSGFGGPCLYVLIYFLLVTDCTPQEASRKCY